MASTEKAESDDDLYYQAYAAGVLFVIVSLTFNGCLFYTCYPGMSNFDTVHAGWSPTGVVSPFARLVGPAALTLSHNGVPLGRIVSTVLEIRQAISQWPLFAALSKHMYPTDEQVQKDLFFLTYAVLLTWPLLHQLLIDRQNYIKMLKEA